MRVLNRSLLLWAVGLMTLPMTVGRTDATEAVSSVAVPEALLAPVAVRGTGGAGGSGADHVDAAGAEGAGEGNHVRGAARRNLDEVGKRVHIHASGSFASQEWFRGIPQENQDLIFRAQARVHIDVIQIGDAQLGLQFKSRNVFTLGPSGLDGPNADGWYESDFYAGGFVKCHSFRFDIGYMAQFAPGAGRRFAEEVSFRLGYDDAKHWEGKAGGKFLGVRPYIFFATETDTGRDSLGPGGGERGNYLELGVKPTILVFDHNAYPVTLVVPVRIGLNLDDYYETGGVDNNDAFGFLEIGAKAKVPLDALIGVEFGRVSAFAGVYMIHAGESALRNGAGVLSGGRDTSLYVVFGADVALD